MKELCMIQAVKDIFKPLEQITEIDQYLQTRKQRISFLLGLILVGFSFILSFIFLVIVPNYSAGVGALFGAVAVTISLVLIIYKRINLGSGLMLISMEIMIYAVFYLSVVSRGMDAGTVAVTIIGLSIIALIPSGILINSLFTIITGIIFAATFTIIIFLSNNETMISRIPVFIGVFGVAIALIVYITSIQNSILKRAISESMKSRASFENLTAILDEVDQLRNESKKSQEMIAEQLSEIMSSIQEYSEKIVHLAEQSDRLQGGVNKGKNNLSLLLTEVDNVHTNVLTQKNLVQENSATQEQVNNTVQEISQDMKESQEINRQLSQVAQTGKERIETLISQVNLLGEYQDNLKKIIHVISNLASQTNLLAMNASIEAAHAGSYGLGFNVVAEEVRTLADNSASQATQIATIVQTMNQTLEGTIEQIKKIGDDFISVNDQAQNSYSFISRTADHVERFASQNNSALDGSRKLLEITSSITSSSLEEKALSDSFLENYTELSDYFTALAEIVQNLTSYDEKSKVLFQRIEQIKEQGYSINDRIDELLKRE
jgi:methyl-accepting chemotaxis protein